MAPKPRNYLINVAVAICLVQLSVGMDLLSYTVPSEEVGNRLMSYDPKNSIGFPHEYGFGHYYQGDILLRIPKKGRIAIADPYGFDKWYKGVVPYVIKASFNSAERQVLQAAFTQFATKTCVRFVPRTTELHYITITNRPEGCYSYVGRSPDVTQNMLNLQTPACMTNVGTPVHELMHSLGFLHEQSRFDRDDYIEVKTTNLRPEYQDPQFIETNFGKYNESDEYTYGAPYNYASVMHYSRYAGAASLSQPVLSNLKLFAGDFGNDKGLSAMDVKQIMARYCTK
ncbi:astacin-like [Anopheles nili]|uniref:astacin-like n=1 Tax=Anopheles nili TaxID=185578 RepID=UPI00237B6371|nr:astacin-like [Anopheles nili]